MDIRMITDQGLPWGASAHVGHDITMAQAYGDTDQGDGKLLIGMESGVRCSSRPPAGHELLHADPGSLAMHQSSSLLRGSLDSKPKGLVGMYQGHRHIPPHLCACFTFS